MENLEFKVVGTGSLLMNNPQSVDPFNAYAKAKKVITSKRAKTEEDLFELQRLDVESKVYMDNDIGVYIPTSWIMAALAQTSFKKVKIAKKDIRAGVFVDDTKSKLIYRDIKKIKEKSDVSGNPDFYHTMLLKQGQVKIAKSTPIFHDWSFTTSLTFDPGVIDKSTLVNILQYCCNYGGFGDFRPTFGRADLELLN